MVYAIVALAFAALGFSGTALAFALRSGELRVDKTRLSNQLTKSEGERAETRDELRDERTRSKKQLENLREKLTDLEDLLATCSDPAVIHEHLDRVLSAAAEGSLG